MTRPSTAVGCPLNENTGAENELRSLTRQCVAGRRFGDIPALRTETSAWSTDVNDTRRGVDWQMETDDARCKLKFVSPKIKL